MNGLIQSFIPLLLFILATVFLFSMFGHEQTLISLMEAKLVVSGYQIAGSIVFGYFLNSLFTDLWTKAKGNRGYVTHKD